MSSKPVICGTFAAALVTDVLFAVLYIVHWNMLNKDLTLSSYGQLYQPYSQWYKSMMQRQMTDFQLWWCIVSTSSHDRCLNGGNSFITDGRKAARLARNDICIYDGSLSDWDNLLLLNKCVYVGVKPLHGHKSCHKHCQSFEINLVMFFKKLRKNATATECLQIFIIKSHYCQGDLT